MSITLQEALAYKNTYVRVKYRKKVTRHVVCGYVERVGHTSLTLRNPMGVYADGLSYRILDFDQITSIEPQYDHPSSTTDPALIDLVEVLQEAFTSEHGHRKQIAETICEIGTLLLKKHADYGASVFKPPVLLPKMTAEKAVFIRMSDKIQRLTHLLESGSNPMVQDESLRDTLMDLAGYAILALAAP